MFSESVPVKGELKVWGVRNGVKTLDWYHQNTCNVALYTNLRNVLINRSIEYGVDAIAWGSYSSPAGSFVSSDYSGTTSTGTQGGMVQSSVGSISAKFSGTFS